MQGLWSARIRGTGWGMVGLLVLALLAGPLAQTVAAQLLSAEEAHCLVQVAESGLYDHLSIAQLRQRCCDPAARDEMLARLAQLEPAVSDLQRRGQAETLASRLPFALVAHRRNYLLPLSYDRQIAGSRCALAGDDIDRFEVKFQFSVKVPLWQQLFGSRVDLWAGYSQLSLWQAYNSDFSSPFRETNYAPELFLTLPEVLASLGLAGSRLSLGFIHESNGRGGSQSRSWNRLYADLALSRGPLTLHLKPWYRLPEERKARPTSSGGDDNPDIQRYLGYGELGLDYRLGRQLFALQWRNNLRRGDNKGAVQLEWIFPLTEHLHGYIQYFNGYGETLIDYNRSSNRLGLGVTLANGL